MTRRALPVVLFSLLVAGSAKADTPFDAFARLLDDAGSSFAKMTAPAPRRYLPPATFTNVPLPNLRPDDVEIAALSQEAGTPIAVGPAKPEAALPPSTAAFAALPAAGAPRTAAPFEAVAPVAPLPQLTPPPAPAPAPVNPAAPAPYVAASLAPAAATPADAQPAPLQVALPASDVDPRPASAVETAPNIPTYHPRPPVIVADPTAKGRAPVVTASLSPVEPTATTKPAAPLAASPVAPAPAAVAVPVAKPAAPAATTAPVTTAATGAAPLPKPGVSPTIPAEGTTSCAVALAAFHVKVAPASGLAEGECRVAAPVTVTGADDIAVMPKALIDCATAATLAAWLQDAVAPRAEAILGQKLTAIRVLDSYNCRTVDNIKGANLSEHARGRAVDIGAFKVGERWINVTFAKDVSEVDAKFLDAIRKSACGPFTTVLGPGSDVYHYNHFHVDLQQRQTAGPSKGLYCT